MVGASTLHVRNSRVECENVQDTAATGLGTYTPPGGYSAKFGGAIASSAEAQVTIEGSSIEGCGAKESGGVLFHESARCAPRRPPMVSFGHAHAAHGHSGAVAAALLATAPSVAAAGAHIAAHTHTLC